MDNCAEISRQALRRAIDLRGSQGILAKDIETWQPQIACWSSKSRRGVTVEWVMPICTATAGEIYQHDLRHDLVAAAKHLGDEVAP